MERERGNSNSRGWGGGFDGGVEGEGVRQRGQ